LKKERFPQSSSSLCRFRLFQQILIDEGAKKIWKIDCTTTERTEQADGIQIAGFPSSHAAL